jgi:DNA-directed RNA polymerase subunit N (RpoN/RPB10)
MNFDIETLDKLFSEYVRLRDSDQYGMIRCISCGKRVKWQYADAGHFVSRKHMSLRFDNNNVNSQCVDCNRFKSGNFKKYKRGLIIKHGRFIIDYLENKKNEIRQFTDFEIELMCLHYKKQIKILKQKKS